MTKVRVGWDFFGGKEFQPLSLPEGYGQTRLLDGVGDESSFITDEQVDQFMESLRRNDQHLDERTSRPMIGVGVDTTL